jgi:hypothetical protein
MRVGDVLELLGGACLTAGAGVLGGVGVGLVVGGLALGFEAQMYGSTPLPRISRERGRWRRRLRRPAEQQHDTAQAAV